MKVYVVTSGDYSDYHIDAMFSTRELAEAFINGSSKYEIVEYVLDEKSGVEMVKTEYAVSVVLQSSDTLVKSKWNEKPVVLREPGELFNEWAHPVVVPVGLRSKKGSEPELAGQKVRSWIYELTSNEQSKRVELPAVYRSSFQVHSYVSKEHARKLAVEAYQAYLRAKAVDP